MHYGYINVVSTIKTISDKINVYPGFVHDYDTHSCKSSQCLSERSEKKDFFDYLYKEYELYADMLSPRIIKDSCMLRALNGFLIDPKGNIYKCWHHLGNSTLSIGNVLNEECLITKYNLFARYMKTADNLDDSSCLNCQLFPVCDGGCPDLRIKNKLERSNFDNCSIFKGDINKYIELKYSFLRKREKFI